MKIKIDLNWINFHFKIGNWNEFHNFEKILNYWNKKKNLLTF